MGNDPPDVRLGSRERGESMSEETDLPRRSDHDARWRQSRHWNRLALILTLALIVVVLVSLPFALSSMRAQLFGEQTSVLYDLVSGRALTPADAARTLNRSEEHTSELQSLTTLVCRLLLEKKNDATSQSLEPDHRNVDHEERHERQRHHKVQRAGVLVSIQRRAPRRPRLSNPTRHRQAGGS